MRAALNVVLLSIMIFHIIRNSEAEQQCCTRVLKEYICSMDSDMGECKAYQDRFFFNRFTGMCHEMMYGGCLGNKNNFKSREECESFCEGAERVTKDCTIKKDRGPCEGLIWRYYYDQDLGSCNTFMYSGCGGNGNNFGTYKECRRTCYESEKYRKAITFKNRKEML